MYTAIEFKRNVATISLYQENVAQEVVGVVHITNYVKSFRPKRSEKYRKPFISWFGSSLDWKPFKEAVKTSTLLSWEWDYNIPQVCPESFILIYTLTEFLDFFDEPPNRGISQ